MVLVFRLQVSHPLGKSDNLIQSNAMIQEFFFFKSVVKAQRMERYFQLGENKKYFMEEKTLKMILKGKWNFHRLRWQRVLIYSIDLPIMMV